MTNRNPQPRTSHLNGRRFGKDGKTIEKSELTFSRPAGSSKLASTIFLIAQGEKKMQRWVVDADELKAVFENLFPDDETQEGSV